jgi:hypothetical protein
MLHRVILGLGVLSLFSWGVAPAPAAWTVVDLGATDASPRMPSQFAPAMGLAINNHGNVAYTLSNPNGDNYAEAYFYNKSGQATVPLGSLDSSLPFADAFAINDNNIVVGDSYYQGACAAIAWKWNGSTGGTMVDLTRVSGGLGADTNNWNAAYGINNLNQVTGYACTAGILDGNGNGYQIPFVADVTNAFGGSPNITYKWLPRPGTVGSDAAGQGVSINASGTVVMNGGTPVLTANGFYNGGTVSSANSWVFPMAASGIDRITCYTTAINNAGYALCEALPAVNPRAWVVHTSTVGDVATTTYDQAVPALVAGGTSFACALNNATNPQVVGYACASGDDELTQTNMQAFIWTHGAPTAINLNTYAAGLVGITNLSGWVFTDAEGINDNREIVGYGLLNGVSHAFALLNYALPGDANGDGTVNISDLSVVLTNYDRTGMSWGQGDFDGNGNVDIQDLSKVLTNYDKTAGASAGIAAVPEPASLILLAVAAGGLMAHARRKRR